MADRVKKILEIFDKLYPFDGKCFLHYETPWQLLFATILSAQCTDDNVNKVTKELFKQYPTIKAFANASVDELERAVFATGFYRNKARNLHNCAKKLLLEYNGEVPSDISQLITFPGVGRKTANVVRGHIFKIPCIVVDTHVNRVSNRLGLVKNCDPVKIEFELMEILPESHWIAYNQQAISHGRKLCKARKPLCNDCELNCEFSTNDVL